MKLSITRTLPLHVSLFLLLLVILLSSSNKQSNINVNALEASFTHAPDKDTGSTDGPLPQSQNQRNQLLELDQQITQSPNPTETLQRVAEANGMDPAELGDLLMRNRRDMEMATGGGAGGANANAGGGAGGGMVNSLPRKMIQLVMALVLMACKSASAHPRSATLVTLAFLSMVYVLYSAPRNGILISGKRGIFSSGMTTILPPPTQYLSDFTMSDKFGRLQGSMSRKSGSSSSSASGFKNGALSKVFQNDNDNDNENGTQSSNKGVYESREQNIENPMFDYHRLGMALGDANRITAEFGVEIVSVSIISANPANKTLMNALSTSAVASAEALQAETHARGMARSLYIEARAAAVAKEIESEADAKALLVRAKTDAEAEIMKSDGQKEAEILRAEGAKEAAKLIESSQVAITLETIKASAMAIKDSDKFFFGQQPEYMSKMLHSNGINMA
mmetsp:Transcript_13448/g.20206  ORF Transcript_13448/g.20206 Transcript_13448/m.20206 type:complete len:450 (+) Transcript_13448:97-1446(+)